MEISCLKFSHDVSSCEYRAVFYAAVRFDDNGTLRLKKLWFETLCATGNLIFMARSFLVSD